MTRLLDSLEEILDGATLDSTNQDITGLEVIDTPDYLPRMGGPGCSAAQLTQRPRHARGPASASG